jgi:peptidyl-tRNA hydrolase
MKKIIILIFLTFNINSYAITPNEMFVVIGAVKYYNENCGGLTHQGMKKMNKSLKHFDMDKTPIGILERNSMAVSGYQTAQKFGCKGTKQQAQESGYGKYIN